MNLPLQTRPDNKIPFVQKPLHIAYTILFSSFWGYTGLTTPDFTNWMLENTLTLSLVIFLIAFYNIFRFSDTSYTFVFLFLMLHVYGSQYQYAENPFGEWLRNTYDLSRNHYDRLVHFGFGLLLAYPIHELLAFKFKAGKFLSYLMPLEIILSLSALYEIVEWIVADVVFKSDDQGMAYLGAQGDVWDAQKDMALALAGAALTISIALLFRKFRKHNR